MYPIGSSAIIRSNNQSVKVLARQSSGQSDTEATEHLTGSFPYLSEVKQVSKNIVPHYLVQAKKDLIWIPSHLLITKERQQCLAATPEASAVVVEKKMPAVNKERLDADVSWASQASGKIAEKSGSVAVVVPPNTPVGVALESQGITNDQYAFQWDGMHKTRDHESYLVAVQRGKLKAYLYWPRTAVLNFG